MRELKIHPSMVDEFNELAQADQVAVYHMARDADLENEYFKVMLPTGGVMHGTIVVKMDIVLLKSFSIV